MSRSLPRFFSPTHFLYLASLTGLAAYFGGPALASGCILGFVVRALYEHWRGWDVDDG